ncbi:MAG: Asp-tRNA(Asn)/Glu-tRNA(Gln) amidotransferase subunit GatB [Rhizobiales bacterium TMED168]|nr:MAG: Asp-tRNA(Asn)/Glu-tRNA(Gln) amidotransferase subunit GatB [Rhizobiales bacterium TMED168]|tara:strand:- start:11191 stop:12660 length:1470 start_codon:yes stop_codon:yes gene_type:complete
MVAEVSNLIKGNTGDWEIVIGIEVHAQIISNSKLFSGSSTSFGSEHNTQVSFVDAGMPGMLPVINSICIEQAIKTGLGLNAKINNFSIFDRKNYFYPDLPQGYQISQFEQPIVGNGMVSIDLDNGKTKNIGIERLHLEQDAGKSLHDQHPSYSFVDLNRSGVALMEIVSMPDMRSPDEAQAYVKKLRNIMKYLQTCDGNMEEGSLRADINVSVRKPGENLGTRCEIKNVNSIKFIGQAIVYESKRQIDLIEKGGIIEQQTRLFDPKKMQTRAMRSKEESHDYRYFPDPDLLPLTFTTEFVDEIKQKLPELPDIRKNRFIESYGLSTYDASILVSEKETADFFEIAAKKSNPKLICNWIIGELFSVLNKKNKSIEESPIKAIDLGELINLIDNDTITGRIAKDVFEIMLETGENPNSIVDSNNMRQVNDLDEIEKIIDVIIINNPNQVEALSTKPNLIGWFVGQVMKESQGKANPKTVNDILNKKLLNKD